MIGLITCLIYCVGLTERVLNADTQLTTAISMKSRIGQAVDVRTAQSFVCVIQLKKKFYINILARVYK